jgi:hypothetical protein
MKFLIPIGGEIPCQFGVLTSPKHTGVPLGIKKGLPWAADNDCFQGSFDFENFLNWLNQKMQPYKDTCLFITVPDVLADSKMTMVSYSKFAPLLSTWPLAFVAQDGLVNLPDLTPDYRTLFIGGTTEFKLSEKVVNLISQARARNKHVHIGRVNWKKRYNHFRKLPGSDRFTCDGTRVRFQGRDKTIRAWLNYMAQIPLSSSLPGFNNCGQSDSSINGTLFHRD